MQLLPSLLDRFRGGLLGAAIAEAKLAPETSRLTPATQASDLLLPMSDRLRAAFEQQIPDPFNLAKVDRLAQTLQAPSQVSLSSGRNGWQDLDLGSRILDAVFLTIPTALIWHDAGDRLEYALALISKATIAPDIALDNESDRHVGRRGISTSNGWDLSLKNLGRTVALLATGRTPNHILRANFINSPLEPTAEKMRALYEAIAHPAPLAEVKTRLSLLPRPLQPIFASLSCVLTEPIHWELSVRRASQLLPDCPRTQCLVGCLAGLAVGGKALPIRDRLRLSPERNRSYVSQTDRLFARWAGIPLNTPTETLSAIAAVPQGSDINQTAALR